MAFITFIYKFGKNPKTYYGKYCADYISDDHEGLDIEVKYILEEALCKKYNNNNNNNRKKPNIQIGILSFSSHKIIPTNSSKNEIRCFDFYYTYDNKTYINGKLLL